MQTDIYEMKREVKRSGEIYFLCVPKGDKPYKIKALSGGGGITLKFKSCLDLQKDEKQIEFDCKQAMIDLKKCGYHIASAEMIAKKAD